MIIRWQRLPKLWLLLLTLVTFNSGCVQNAAYRTKAPAFCYQNNCESAFIEHHNHPNEGYDLAFVEFSERGNVFDRERMNEVIQYINNQEKNSRDGIMLLVYAHGWHHNAKNQENGDVNDFRNTLRITSKNRFDKRKVIGVYIGWRGESLGIDHLNLVTYWGRKNTARQVGGGSVSELLLRLNQIAARGEEHNKNIFVITGHSLGAALILTAMKDALLERLISAQYVKPGQCGTVRHFRGICSAGCYKARSFGDGIFLVNPAVEANALVQIKEYLSEQRCYKRDQPKLMHILSSDTDLPTRYAFGIGQFIGVSLMDQEASLTRRIFIGDSLQRKKIYLDEHELDTFTIGNYPVFRTGRSTGINGYEPCEGKGNCISDEERKTYGENFPVAPFEPVSIIYVDKSFMKGHNDIFNKEVLSYIATAIIENKYKQNPNIVNKHLLKECTKKDEKKKVTRFSFQSCQSVFRKVYSKDLPD